MRAPNVFTISPALPFLETFVAALSAGEVVPGFMPAADPLALADITIYVPTRRAAQALSDVFLVQDGAASAVLPRILPLGALEATEAPLIFAEPEPGASGLPLPPVAAPIWRRLQLATLIQQWSQAIAGALCGVDRTGQLNVDDSESFRVATTPVDAFALAGELAGLIDEMQIEGVAWRALDELRMAGFDDYWRITTTFLSIAVEAWPNILEQNGLIDPAQRQIALVESQAHDLAEGRRTGPVIAIGSTGTNRATARLLAAIAHAPNGALVLPGLDQDLDDAAWALIAGKRGEGQEPSFGHPQAAMARLLPILGVDRASVRALGTPVAQNALKARFVAEALRPADTTDQWRAFRRAHPQKTVAETLAGVRLVEAADEREEALCIAVAMREVLETPGRTAALVTPDRELARRVRGELLRWSIEVDDTGGEPLTRRPLGILARLVTACAAGAMAARDLGALLAHPLAAFGRKRSDVGYLAQKIEVAVLRAVPLRAGDAAGTFADARAVADDRHVHPAQKLRDETWVAMETLWSEVVAALAPLTALRGAQSLAVWVEAHRTALAAIADPADADETEKLEELFDALAEAGDSNLRFEAAEYDIFFAQLAHEVVLRNTDRPHPRLQILGLLEARLLRADVTLLGGLDETVWPPQARTDPFLNRPMRQELGLTPPERRIGQTAHDFEQAMGSEKIVLTRAMKRGGSPTVASRFLLRLEALAGDAWKAVRVRGAETLGLARLLDDTRKAAVPCKRPSPRPPVSQRPTGLTVTQIETLRRDPYAIFASKVLRLAPLPQIGAEIDPSQFGMAMHEALHRFCQLPAVLGTVQERRDALDTILRDVFASSLDDPMFERFRWPTVRKAAKVFLDFDAQQRAALSDMLTEAWGQLDLTLADQSTFRLGARADRIDFHADASATLIDYKTGSPPGNSEIAVGFAPQLTLEAAILQRGGFRREHNGAVDAVYLKLGGKDGGRRHDVAFKDESFADVVARHMDNLLGLLSSFRSIETGYTSRPFPKFIKDEGVYDHLARFREWGLAAEDEVPP